MLPISINNIEQYELIKSRGFEPLLDFSYFSIDIKLRIEIQYLLFGDSSFSRVNVGQSNIKFYKWVWDHKLHVCEETMKPLPNYSSVHISHILTRSSHSEIALDPRNTNILSYEAHNKWESGNKKRMRIYRYNQYIIKLLKNEYK